MRRGWRWCRSPRWSGNSAVIRCANAFASGSSITSRAPRWYSASTAIVPPAASTTPRHTESPSPVPSPTSFVVTNGSKIRSRIDSGIPGPVSSTSIRARRPALTDANGDDVRLARPLRARGERRSGVEEHVEQDLREPRRGQREDLRPRARLVEREAHGLERLLSAEQREDVVGDAGDVR